MVYNKEMKQVALRISPKLYDSLKKQAKEQHRSMTAQASLLLERALGLAQEPKERVMDVATPEETDADDIWNQSGFGT